MGLRKDISKPAETTSKEPDDREGLTYIKGGKRISPFPTRCQGPSS